MGRNFEEIDYRSTRLGELSLRRRRLPFCEDQDVYEVKLGEDFLMSSLFTEGELALSRLALEEAGDGDIDVVVGGLGLGYTAAAALDFPNVSSLIVVEGLAPVIEWHRKKLLPLSARLTTDPRCRLIEGDFFHLAAPDGQGFDPVHAGRRYHAILLDIDHSPSHVLNAAHQPYYEPEGLRWLGRHLLPGGIYALWSNELPDDAFLRKLHTVFAAVSHHVVRFENPFQGGDSANTIYIAKTDPAA